jgi:hypothetical protein
MLPPLGVAIEKVCGRINDLETFIKVLLIEYITEHFQVVVNGSWTRLSLGVMYLLVDRSRESVGLLGLTAVCNGSRTCQSLGVVHLLVDLRGKSIGVLVLIAVGNGGRTCLSLGVMHLLV